MRTQLDGSRAQYRIIGQQSDGSADLAVWLIDYSADPFTDDTPRIGIACVRLLPTTPLTSEPTACPPRLALEVDADGVDWSDKSLAYEAALLRIDEVLTEVQWKVKDGEVRTVPDAVAALESRGLVITPDEAIDDADLHATAKASADGPLISDVTERASATSCSTIVVSVDPMAPFYTRTEEQRPC